jgi:hypothetical protein
MRKQIQNRLYNTRNIRRVMRVVNDDTGEYHDVLMPSGTGSTERQAIADYAHVLSGSTMDSEYMTDVGKFKWTRIYLALTDGMKIVGKVKGNGEPIVGHSRIIDGENWMMYYIDPDTFEITESKLIQSQPI